MFRRNYIGKHKTKMSTTQKTHHTREGVTKNVLIISDNSDQWYDYEHTTPPYISIDKRQHQNSGCEKISTSSCYSSDYDSIENSTPTDIDSDCLANSDDSWNGLTFPRDEKKWNTDVQPHPEFCCFKNVDTTSYIIVSGTRLSLDSHYFHQSSPLRFYNLSSNISRDGIDNVISQLRRNRTINGRRGTQMDISVIPKDSKNVNRGGNVSTKACVIHNDPHQAVFMTKDGINIQPLFPSSYKISKKEKKCGHKMVICVEWYRLCSITTDGVKSSCEDDNMSPSKQFLLWALETSLTKNARVKRKCRMNFLPVLINGSTNENTFPFVRTFDIWFADSLQSELASQYFTDSTPSPKCFAQWFPLVFGDPDIDTSKPDMFDHAPMPYLLRLYVDKNESKYDAGIASINPVYASWWHGESYDTLSIDRKPEDIECPKFSFIQTPVGGAQMWNTHQIETHICIDEDDNPLYKDNTYGKTMSVVEMCSLFWGRQNVFVDENEHIHDTFSQMMKEAVSSLHIKGDGNQIHINIPTIVCFSSLEDAISSNRRRMRYSKKIPDKDDKKRIYHHHRFNTTLQYHKNNISYTRWRHLHEYYDCKKLKYGDSSWQSSLDLWSSASSSCLKRINPVDYINFSRIILDTTLIRAIIARFDNDMLPSNSDIFDRIKSIPVEMLNIQDSSLYSDIPQVLHLGKTSIVYSATYPGKNDIKNVVIKCVDARFFGDHYAMVTRVNQNGVCDGSITYPKKIALPYTLSMAIREIKMDLWILSSLPKHENIVKLIGWTTLGGTCLASVIERMDMSFALFICITDAIIGDSNRYTLKNDYLRASRNYLCTPDVGSDEVCDDIIRKITNVYCEQSIYCRLMVQKVHVHQLRRNIKRVCAVIRNTWIYLKKNSYNKMNTGIKMSRNDTIVTILWMRISSIRQIANGLDHLHKYGFVHRDVKPGNFGVNFDKNDVSGDNTINARLFDFGYGITMSNIFRTVAGNIKHQPIGFMVPNSHRYMVYDDGSCDVYAILRMLLDSMVSITNHIEDQMTIDDSIQCRDSLEYSEYLIKKMRRWIGWADLSMVKISNTTLKSVSIEEVHKQSIACPIRERERHILSIYESEEYATETHSNETNITNIREKKNTSHPIKESRYNASNIALSIDRILRTIENKFI